MQRLQAMQAYNNDPSLKEQIVNLMKEHQTRFKYMMTLPMMHYKIDKGFMIGIAQGWDDGVDYNEFEAQTGIPVWLLRVAQKLFEGATIEHANSFAVDFFESIIVGKFYNDDEKWAIVRILTESIAINKFECPENNRLIGEVIREVHLNQYQYTYAMAQAVYLTGEICQKKNPNIYRDLIINLLSVVRGEG